MGKNKGKFLIYMKIEFIPEAVIDYKSLDGSIKHETNGY